MKSFYFHDYETSGTDPALDWPTQFAGIRTDAELNEIGEPLNIFCQLPKDHLPHPIATLVTRLTPQYVNQHGLIEPEFIKLIHNEMMTPETCVTGYNNIRFDDEITRHALYRNFYDPYAREWQNNNSRWDLIDMIRLVGALRPEGIEWPLREDGAKSFRLEELTSANNLDHGAAHDALSDVRATLALARLIRDRQPKVFFYCLNHRNKTEVSRLLNLIKQDMVVHVSGMFGSDRNNLALVIPLIKHPVNNNGIVVYDLSVNSDPLLSLSVEDIRKRLFTASKDLPEGEERIPLKTIHINKCPVIAPTNVLRAKDQDRLEIDLSFCEENRKKLLTNKSLKQKLMDVFAEQPRSGSNDPDQMLYSGGFFSKSDRYEMDRIISPNNTNFTEIQLSFNDKRLDEMLFRYRGRHYSDTFDLEEKLLWQKYCKDRLSGQLHHGDDRLLSFDQFWEDMTSAKHEIGNDQKKIELLEQLSDYVRHLQHEIS